jgi:hypothetical protein
MGTWGFALFERLKPSVIIWNVRVRTTSSVLVEPRTGWTSFNVCRAKKIRPRLSRKSKRHATGTLGWPIKSAPARQPIHQSSLRGRPTRPRFTGTGTSGGGGNRTAGSSPDSDDSRTVSRTGIEQNTSKEHEEDALPDILMTMSQIPVPDVTGELAEVRAMFEVVDALRRKRGR